MARHQRPSTAEGGAPGGEAKVDARVACTIVPCLDAALSTPKAGARAAALSASLSARSITCATSGVVISSHQMSSAVITCATSGVVGGHQRRSVAHQWQLSARVPSVAISGALRGNQRQSVVIRGDPSHSHLMRGAIMGNERCHQRRSEPFAPECLSGAWDAHVALLPTPAETRGSGPCRPRALTA